MKYLRIYGFKEHESIGHKKENIFNNGCLPPAVKLLWLPGWSVLAPGDQIFFAGPE